MAEDPYFALKDEVQTNVSNTQKLFQNWQNSLNDPNSSSSAVDSFKRDTDALKEALRDIDEDLSALEETISIVESNPAKFRLDVREIGQRKDFIAKIKRQVQDMRSVVSQPSLTRTREEKAAREALFQPSKTVRTTDKYGRTEEEYRMSNARFIEREQQQQQMLMRQQDEQMDDVYDTVVGLKDIATVMGNELEDQTLLLRDMESQVDTTAGKLQLGIRRMNDFIKANSSSKQQYCIIVLIIILVILLIMVITL
ncbi:Syntaxin-6 [Rhizophlyctis rosea]|nr:Syntaxin-6 [Rhizophlyctis rosea]